MRRQIERDIRNWYSTVFYIYIIFFFQKKAEEHWVIRNVKYIYANNEDEAKEKYK